MWTKGTGQRAHEWWMIFAPGVPGRLSGKEWSPVKAAEKTEYLHGKQWTLTLHKNPLKWIKV